MSESNFRQTARDTARGVKHHLQTSLAILGTLLAIFWVVEGVDWILGGWLDRFGIIPRTTVGLRGILLAPFLHGGWAHLMANSVPFAVLGWLVLLRGAGRFWTVSAIAMLVGGLGTWLTGAPGSVHIGASGVIFGYLGYLLLSGWFERSFRSIALSLFVVSAYGSLLWGVLPAQPGISWQGHLFGFLGGAIAARFLVPTKTASPSVDPSTLL